jgi:hypothetical protein
MWIAAGVATLLAVGLAAGVAISLRKTAPAADPTPEPTPQPTPRVNPPRQPTPKVDPIPSGRGLIFGPDQFVEIPSLSLPNEGPFTLEGYVTVGEAFRGEGNLFGSRFRFRAVVVERDGETLWEAHSVIGGNNPSTGVGGVNRGRRAHIAAVRSAGDIRLFVDGKATQPSPAIGTLAGSGPVRIGGERFVGTIEEVRISFAARYDRDFTPPVRLDSDRQTAALYQFDEGFGDRVRDSSGNGHDGRIVGPRWVANRNDPGPGPGFNPLTQEQFNQLLPLYLMSHQLPGRPQLSPDGVNALRATRFVQSIQIGPLDDIAFVRLSDLPLAAGLQRFTVMGPDGILPISISNAALESMPRFRELTSFVVQESQINDDGLKPLTTVPKLTQLTLRKCRITDKAATHLVSLQKVTALNLSETQFGDEGIKGLVDMPALTELTLIGNPVTDEGLEHLHNSKLTLLNVQRTKVTAEGIRKLKTANPTLNVLSDAKP